MVVVDVLEAGLECLAEYLGARGVPVDSLGKVLVRVQHGANVPQADPVVVGIVEANAGRRVEADQRERVVHDRRAILRARREVVLEAERVADLVGRQLADARKRHVEHRVRHIIAVVGPGQAFRDKVVLAHAQRTERHVAFEDLARARVDDRVAVRPAARRPMHPLDDVIANVERVRVLGEHLDAKRVAIPGGFERLVPPARAFEQCASHGLGRPGIEVVDDRLDRLADLGRGVDFLEPVTDAVIPLQRVADGRCIVRESAVAVGNAEDARPRIERQRLVALVRQANERVMHVHGHGRRVRHDSRQMRTGRLARQRHDGLDLTVVGKDPGPRQVDHRPARIHFEAAFLGLVEPRGEAMRIANEERRAVDEDLAVALLDDVESPQDGARERLVDSLLLTRVVAVGPEVEIVRRQEDAGPAPEKADDVPVTELATVEAEIVRADAPRERRLVQERLVEGLNADQQLARLLVPVKIDEAVETLVLGDRRRCIGRRRTGGERQDEGEGKGQAHADSLATALLVAPLVLMRREAVSGDRQ